MKKINHHSSTVLIMISIILISLMFFSFGCAKKEEKEIKIGAILPLTGDAAKYGDVAKMGIDLAVDEINTEGGILGSKIRIIYEDDKANSKDGVNAVQKLIDQKVPAIIGAMPSSVMLAIAPIAEKNKVVLLSPTASYPKISDAGDYIFRNCPSDTYEGGYLAQFVRRKLHIAKVAVLYINNDYGIGLKNVFSKGFEENGGKIVLTGSFEQEGTDFRTPLLKMKASNPEAIFLVGHKEMIRILIQARKLGIKSRFLSSVMFDDPEILEKSRNAAEGVIFTTWFFDPTSESAIVRKFVTDFKSKYKTSPEVFAAQAYDAVYLLKTAVEKNGKTSDDIKRGLYDIKDYPGVSGITTFDKNGDVTKPLRMMQVKNGKFVSFNE